MTDSVDSIEPFLILTLRAEVNALTAPSKHAEVCTTFKGGTLLDLILVEGDYYYARSGKSTGWVHKADLKEVNDLVQSFLHPSNEPPVTADDIDLVLQFLNSQNGRGVLSDGHRAVEAELVDAYNQMTALHKSSRDFNRGYPSGESGLAREIAAVLQGAPAPTRPPSVSFTPRPLPLKFASAIPADIPPKRCFVKAGPVSRMQRAATQFGVQVGGADPKRRDDAIWAFQWAMAQSISRLDRFQPLFFLAQSSLGRGINAEKRLDAEIRRLSNGPLGLPHWQGSGFSGPQADLDSFIPDHQLFSGASLDQCRIERILATSEVLNACICFQFYEVREIRTDHESDASGTVQACGPRGPRLGETITILGSGFGDTRPFLPPNQLGEPTGQRPSFGSGLLSAHVVFPGDNGVDVPVLDEGSYDGWYDDRILVRIPPGAASGALTIVTPCRGQSFAGRCVSRRHPSGDSRLRSLLLIPPATIRIFEARPRGRAVDLMWNVSWASSVTISGPGLVPDDQNPLPARGQRTITIPCAVAHGEHEYEIVARDICGGMVSERTVANIKDKLTLSAPPMIRKDASRDLSLTLSCPAPADVRVRLVSSAAIQVPVEVTIPNGSLSTTVQIRGISPGEATLAATVENDGYDGVVELRIFVTPFIRDVRSIPGQRSIHINGLVEVVGVGFEFGDAVFFRLRTGNSVRVEPSMPGDRSMACTVPEDTDEDRIGHVAVGRDRPESNEVRISISKPEVSGVMPRIVTPGQLVNIVGQGFSLIASYNSVQWSNGDNQQPLRVEPDLLKGVRVPDRIRSSFVLTVSGRTSLRFPVEVSRSPGMFTEAMLDSSLSISSTCGVVADLSNVPGALPDRPSDRFRFSLRREGRLIEPGPSVPTNEVGIHLLRGGLGFAHNCDLFFLESLDRSTNNLSLSLFTIGDTVYDSIPSFPYPPSALGNNRRYRIWVSPDASIVAVQSTLTEVTLGGESSSYPFTVFDTWKRREVPGTGGSGRETILPQILEGGETMTLGDGTDETISLF